MGKIKTTRREIKENFKCYGFGYCALQNILYFENARFYTCGVYGWNFDAFVIEHNGQEICLTTGYRGMIYNDMQNITYDTVKEFDNKAEKIICNNTLSYDNKKIAVTALLHEFLDELIGENKNYELKN
jgi:hypothetical protein